MTTINRLMRLILLMLILATALPGLATSAHAACGDGVSDPAGQHVASQHVAGGNHENHAAPAPNDDDQAQRDSSVTICHSAAAGCPGCVTPEATLLPLPRTARLVFPHISVSGESADRSGALRPPRTS